MKKKSNYKKKKRWYEDNVSLVLVTMFFLPIGVYGFYKRISRHKIRDEKENIPRIWNIPLYDHNLSIKKTSNKDLEKLEGGEGSIVGHIGFLCMIALFIYFWIVDFGKPGLMDEVIDVENTTNPEKLIVFLQFLFDFLPRGFVNFIADLFLYGFISVITGAIVALVLNFIFKRLF